MESMPQKLMSENHRRAEEGTGLSVFGFNLFLISSGKAFTVCGEDLKLIYCQLGNIF